jgi:hypothetical protein
MFCACDVRWNIFVLLLMPSVHRLLCKADLNSNKIYSPKRLGLPVRENPTFLGPNHLSRSPKTDKSILFKTLLYATLRYSTLLYATLRYSTLLYDTLRYSTLLYATLSYSTPLYATLRYSTLLYATLRYSTLLYATLRYSTLLETVWSSWQPSPPNKEEKPLLTINTYGHTLAGERHFCSLGGRANKHLISWKIALH